MPGLMERKYDTHCGRCKWLGVVFIGGEPKELWLHPIDDVVPMDHDHIIAMRQTGSFTNDRVGKITRDESNPELVIGMNRAAGMGLLTPEQQIRWGQQ